MLIRNDIWKLGKFFHIQDNGKYIRLKLSQIYPKLVKSDTKKITLFKNYHPIILKEIAFCNY